MAMTTTHVHAPLSPHKERRNRDFIYVIHSPGKDLSDLQAGKQREKRENSGIRSGPGAEPFPHWRLFSRWNPAGIPLFSRFGFAEIPSSGW